jgi:hypothetical protein
MSTHHCLHAQFNFLYQLIKELLIQSSNEKTPEHPCSSHSKTTHFSQFILRQMIKRYIYRTSYKFS